MSKFDIDLQEMLCYIDLHDNVGFDDSHIEKLEEMVSMYNAKMNDLEAIQVADSIYDTLRSMLKEVKPDSKVLGEIWDDEGDITEYTELLESNPMMSIETAKSYDCDELMKFISIMPSHSSYFASYKINGHGIRVVYKDGDLVSATSRARASAGRDLTRQLRVILGDRNEALADYGQVELRGEIALKIDRMSEAREFNPKIKSPFSAVSSLIKPSATNEEASLLSFLCYGFLCEGFEFDTKDDEYQEILNCGFETPEYSLIEDIESDDLLEQIQSIMSVFEDNYEEFGYFCDGVVLELNDRSLFHELGIEGNHNRGNVALKVGVWKQDNYCGIVNKIIWTKGKNKLSPVAIVSDNEDDLICDEDDNPTNLNNIGVLTAQGNSVKRVPLYEPKNIIVLDAYIGEPLHFKYGGEAGVVPCFPDGRLLKEDEAKEILTGESGWGSWDSFAE